MLDFHAINFIKCLSDVFTPLHLFLFLPNMVDFFNLYKGLMITCTPNPAAGSSPLVDQILRSWLTAIRPSWCWCILTQCWCELRTWIIHIWREIGWKARLFYLIFFGFLTMFVKDLGSLKFGLFLQFLLTCLNLIYLVTSPTLSGSCIFAPQTWILAYNQSTNPIEITRQSLKLFISQPLSQAAISPPNLVTSTTQLNGILRIFWRSVNLSFLQYTLTLTLFCISKTIFPLLDWFLREYFTAYWSHIHANISCNNFRVFLSSTPKFMIHSCFFGVRSVSANHDLTITSMVNFYLV